MSRMLKSWIRYFIFVCIFGTFVNLLYLSVPIYLMVVYDRVLFSFSKASLVTLSLGVLFSLFVMALLEYFRSRMLVKAGHHFEQEMTPLVLEGMHKDAAGREKTGYKRGLTDLACIKDAIISGSLLQWVDTPWVLIYFVLLYFMHPLISVVALCIFVIAVLFYVLLRVLSKKRFAAADAVAQSNTEFARESMDNAELVSGMGFTRDIIDRYMNTYQRAGAMRFEAEAFKTGTGAVIKFMGAASIAGVYGTGAWLYFVDDITAGAMLAVILITARIFYPLENKLAGLKQGLDAGAAYKRLKTFIDMSKKEKTLDLPRPKGKISVENVVLALKGKTLLRNISFSLEPGESLGIIGPSGSGKTILLKLILGIWGPSAGKIRLDGADAAQWDSDDLGQYLGYVPQRTNLFSGRVDENIARFQSVESESVLKACRKAFVHDMVLKLPDGYNTVIDKGGNSLSEGQGRRISCARALYGDPAVVLMDEPNAGMDEEGIRALLQTMKVLREEKVSLVMVTDNPNLLVNTDKILFLKDGQVSMFGPSKEVLGKLTNRKPTQQES